MPTLSLSPVSVQTSTVMTFIETVLTAHGVALDDYQCPSLDVWMDCSAVLAAGLEHTFKRHSVQKYRHPASAAPLGACHIGTSYYTIPKTRSGNTNL